MCRISFEWINDSDEWETVTQNCISKEEADFKIKHINKRFGFRNGKIV
ncbi:MAG TPA: hypothetical protein VIK78_19845 [Ruminiclostridium sp.]